MSDPTHGDLMRAIGQLEGKMDSMIRQHVEMQKTIAHIEIKANLNAISTARLWMIAAFGTAGGGMAGWLSRMLGPGGGP